MLAVGLPALATILPVGLLHGGAAETGCDEVPFLFSGVASENPDWVIDLDEFGFSDFLLDNTDEFLGREYLSGEWAAAVGYNRNGTVVEPMWLDPKFYFPDWCTNSTFTPVGNFIFSQNSNPDLGFIIESTITNGEVEITMTYEMVDTVTGMAQGLEPASGDTPAHVLSNRYAFRHTYSIKNVSGVEITELNFFQFLHGLETDTSIYDNRNYGEGAPWEDYHYDITQTGQSFSLNQVTGEVVLHDDIIAFHSMVAPVDWENGLYGQPSTDDHNDGKPSAGVHHSVEADELDETMDGFTAPEGRWVSGAQKFALGPLAPDASVEISMLLTIATTFTVQFPGIDIQILHTEISNGTYIIEFYEAIGANLGYGLEESTDLIEWFFAPLSNFTANFVDDKLVFRMETPIGTDPDTGLPYTRKFYRINATPIATPDFD